MLDAAAACLLPGRAPVRVAARAGPVRGPEREVVPEELHDERRVLVAILVQRVQLRDGVVERLGKLKCSQIGTGIANLNSKLICNVPFINNVCKNMGLVDPLLTPVHI